MKYVIVLTLILAVIGCGLSENEATTAFQGKTIESVEKTFTGNVIIHFTDHSKMVMRSQEHISIHE